MLPLIALAQFPVINSGYIDYDEYLATEGVSYPIGGSSYLIWSGKTSSAGDVVSLTGSNWGVDNAYFYKSITVSASQKCQIQLMNYYTTSSIGAAYGLVTVEGATTIPINSIRKLDQSVIFSILDVPEANPNSTPASVNQTGFIVSKSSTTVVNSNLKTYSIVVTITNYSGASSSGSIVVSDSLPRGCEYVSASGTGFSFLQSGKKYTATTSDVIPNNGTKTYTLTVRGIMPISVSSFASGYAISNDTDLSLRPMVWAGTSITNGSGISSYKNNYTYLLRKWLNENLNINVRVVNKAISSSQTNIMEDYRTYNNFYDFKQPPKFLIIEHGVNDVAQGISNATSVLNVTKMISYYRKKYPTCYILILAPFPANAYESGLATYRASMESLVNGLSTQDRVYVKYIAGTGTAWNAATQGGTYTTDGIHVNAAGRLLILDAITSYITSNNLTFP